MKLENKIITINKPYKYNFNKSIDFFKLLITEIQLNLDKLDNNEKLVFEIIKYKKKENEEREIEEFYIDNWKNFIDEINSNFFKEYENDIQFKEIFDCNENNESFNLLLEDLIKFLNLKIKIKKEFSIGVMKTIVEKLVKNLELFKIINLSNFYKIIYVISYVFYNENFIKNIYNKINYFSQIFYKREYEIENEIYDLIIEKEEIKIENRNTNLKKISHEIIFLLNESLMILTMNYFLENNNVDFEVFEIIYSNCIKINENYEFSPNTIFKFKNYLDFFKMLKNKNLDISLSKKFIEFDNKEKENENNLVEFNNILKEEMDFYNEHFIKEGNFMVDLFLNKIKMIKNKDDTTINIIIEQIIKNSDVLN